MKILLKRTIGIILILAFLTIITTIAIDNYVRSIGSKYILSESEIPKADAILVLGAYVTPQGTVSVMLNDRLTVGLDLYKKDKAEKILVS